MPPCKVLVCDDDVDILDMTGMLLEFAGFRVITQINSRKMIDQAIAERPDVMLIDIWMPLPGDQLTKEIKLTPQLAHIPVILFSAAIDGRIIAKEAGADRFIEKPFDVDNLAAIINSVIAA
ncbi:response regulator [Mucilaginibacter daejeonensis]|uniref:response regulator n=1 Tax=Mucilaginibacter daejeonensis TaxID=398049 RepID=UPI001D17BCC8|nr:response regulator [Mucilaginibacter daejeonensis]UEG51381.1 response regulator [Mucilaginibacter daejeonensis]